MNNTLQEFAKNQLKNGLLKCSEKQQLLFKRMYSHNNLDKSIDEVINDMPEDKLDWAMQQVEKTLLKNKLKEN